MNAKLAHNETGQSPQARVLLAFPPLVIPVSPYLAPSLLKAHLQRNGHIADQIDLNLDYYAECVSPTGLGGTADILTDIIDGLNERERLNAQDLMRLKSAVDGLAACAYAADHIDEAKSILRDARRFNRAEDYSWAIATIEQALKGISSAYFPSELNAEGFRSRFSPFSEADIVAFTDTAENPFLDYYRNLLVRKPDLLDHDMIGVSVAFPDQILPAFTFARVLREARTEVGGQDRANPFICFGGNVFCRVGDGLTHAPALFDLVDAIVVGEGEEPIVRLADAIAGRDARYTREDIPGVVRRTAEGVSSNRRAPGLKAKELPTPDFSGLPLQAYLAPEIVFPLMTFKGCSYGQCTFCDHHVNYDKMSARPPEMVAEDIAELHQRYGARRFNFVDEEMPPAHARRLAAALTKTRLAITWMGYAIYRPEWTADDWRDLHASGCREMLFGFESASKRILKLMKKPLELEDVRRITGDLNAVGIASRINVIVGFPGETRGEAESARDFFNAWPNLFDTPGTMIAFHPFLLVRNAPLMENLGREIADVDPRLPLALHYAFEAEKSETLMAAAPAKPLSAQESYVLAKRISSELNADHTDKGAPVWRLHRFLYICQNDAPARGDAGSRPVAEASNDDPLTMRPTVTLVRHRLDALDERLALAGEECDTYRQWMDFTSTTSNILRWVTAQGAFEGTTAGSPTAHVQGLVRLPGGSIHTHYEIYGAEDAAE